MKRLLISALCLAAFFSCSRAEPIINFHSMKLVYFQNETGYRQELAFFVLPDDPDGPDDIDELRLYHDLEGLMWRLTRNDWVENLLDGQIWIGGYGLVPPEGETMPDGLYRAMIIDKGGERSERSFGFDVPAEPRYPFPEITIQNGGYTITSGYPQHYFVGYFEDGSYAVTIPAPEGSLTGTIADLRFSSEVVRFALWADDDEHATAAFTNSYPVR